MTRTLTLSADSFDKVNTFEVNVGKRYPVMATLRRDYEKQDDGIYWALNSGTCLKSHYSEADQLERQRLNSETPLNHGDTVMIDGEEYTVRVLGQYSNCAVFDLK